MNIQEQLLQKYSRFSDEKLREITVKNGYTEEAEMVAQQILGSNREQDEEEVTQPNEDSEAPVENRTSRNRISEILKIIGWTIIVAGSVATIFTFIQGKTIIYPIILELSSLISGMMFFGFSEIIKLLQEINNKL